MDKTEREYRELLVTNIESILGYWNAEGETHKGFYYFATDELEEISHCLKDLQREANHATHSN